MASMAIFSVGDLAKNSKTGQFGKVIGYGHRILNDVYQTTLKVLVVDSTNYVNRIEEDLISAWEKLEESQSLEPVAS
jgi:hypothetical protein